MTTHNKTTGPVKREPVYERWLLTYEEICEYLGFDPFLTKITAISYGEMGTGKSSFWSTVPGGGGRGNLILMFDAQAKAFPYLRGLEIQEGATQYDHSGHLPPVTYHDCFYPDGTFWGRVEYYEEPDPDYPICYETFLLHRAQYLRGDLIENDLGFMPWYVVIDSLTTCQFASLRYQEARNPKYQDARLWYGDMKRDMIRELMVRFAYAPYNVAVIAHEEKAKDEFGGGIVRGISSVGKLGSELPAQYNEVYRHFAKRSANHTEYLLQTMHDGIYPARTAIQAPNPCESHFTAMWRDYEKAHRTRFGLPKEGNG